MHRAIALAFAALCAISLSVSISAQDHAPIDPYFEILLETLHPEDREVDFAWEEGLRARLDAIETEYPDGQNLESIAEIRALLDRPRTPFEERAELVGDWRMRSLQADGLGAYVYARFAGSIYPEAQALVFEKDSGSQRHRGLMAQVDESRVFFAGALYYGYEEPRMYSGHMAEDALNADRDFDTTALVYRLGPDHFLMAFAPAGDRYRLYEITR